MRIKLSFNEGLSLFELLDAFDLLAIPLFALACPSASINVLVWLLSWLHRPSKFIINCCQLSVLLSVLLSAFVANVAQDAPGHWSNGKLL